MVGSRGIVIGLAACWLLLLCGLCVTVERCGASDSDDMLESAEQLFRGMKQHRYQALWPLLTSRSQEAIAKECQEKISGGGTSLRTIEQVREDFAGGGPMATAYWNGFLVTFDPASVLDESKWQIGKIGKEEGTIAILHKKAKGPAQLIMIKEQGAWKVGLTETFWGSRK